MNATKNWTDEQLDALREEGDPAADAAIAAIIGQGETSAVNRLMGQLFRNDAVLPEALPAPVREFLAATAVLPTWADRAKIARGAELFGLHAPRVMLILGHYALPACYAARKGVQVLHATGRLSGKPRPRLLETAQFVCDVMAPDGLAADGLGIRSAQKVRLMHAAVRYLLEQQGWDRDLGRPANQEDMAGTLLTFSYVTIDGLRKLGFAIEAEDAEAYLHTWNVVGAIMGVREALLPADEAAAEALLRTIQRRHFAPSPAGRQLAHALVEMLQESTRGTPFAKVPVSVIRSFLGDEVAAILALPPADWTQHVLGPLRLLGRVTDQAHAWLPLMTQLAENFGCTMMEGLMRMERGGRRAEFRIPASLHVHENQLASAEG